MNSEAKTIIAFLFKRSGKKEMIQSEFYLTLSMDLKWFTPKKAKDFTNWSLKNNILLKSEGVLKPNFNRLTKSRNIQSMLFGLIT